MSTKTSADSSCVSSACASPLSLSPRKGSRSSDASPHGSCHVCTFFHHPNRETNVKIQTKTICIETDTDIETEAETNSKQKEEREEEEEEEEKEKNQKTTEERERDEETCPETDTETETETEAEMDTETEAEAELEPTTSKSSTKRKMKTKAVPRRKEKRKRKGKGNGKGKGKGNQNGKGKGKGKQKENGNEKEKEKEKGTPQPTGGSDRQTGATGMKTRDPPKARCARSPSSLSARSGQVTFALASEDSDPPKERVEPSLPIQPPQALCSLPLSPLHSASCVSLSREILELDERMKRLKKMFWARRNNGISLCAFSVVEEWPFLRQVTPFPPSIPVHCRSLLKNGSMSLSSKKGKELLGEIPFPLVLFHEDASEQSKGRRCVLFKVGASSLSTPERSATPMGCTSVWERGPITENVPSTQPVPANPDPVPLSPQPSSPVVSALPASHNDHQALFPEYRMEIISRTRMDQRRFLQSPQDFCEVVYFTEVDLLQFLHVMATHVWLSLET